MQAKIVMAVLALGLLVAGVLLGNTPTLPADASVPEGARLVTLMPVTGVFSPGATAAGSWITDLQNFDTATVVLSITNKEIDASTTLDLYVQYSPDAGTSVDNLAHLAQITSSAVDTGTYVLYLHRGTAGVGDRATDDGATLAAGALRNISWADRLRIKAVPANFGAADVLTYSVRAYLQ